MSLEKLIIQDNNFKEVLLFLLKKEKKNKNLYVNILSTETVRVVYQNGKKYEWYLESYDTNKGEIYWDGELYKIRHFKVSLNYIFKNYENKN